MISLAGLPVGLLGIQERVYLPPAGRRRPQRNRGGPGRVRRRLRCRDHRWWTLAEACNRLGEPDPAAAYYRRLTASQGVMHEGNLVNLGIAYPFAMFGLARLYQQRGEEAAARDHYLRFLDTFTQPDADVAWMVAEARAALERLGPER